MPWKIPLDAISRFAFSMATCLGSGLPPRKALELSAGVGCSRALRRAAQAAGDCCERGTLISEGLEINAGRLPSFLTPVLKAGELSGRQVEAFHLIHEHCQRLKPALDLVRNTWRYPLICIVTGWTARLLIFVYFGLYSAAWLFFCDSFLKAAVFVMFAWLLLKLSPVKRGVDWLLLQLPLIRETLIRESIVVFFSTFRLVYDAGGVSVLQIFDLAVQTVANTAIRADLCKARPVLADFGSFEDAFDEIPLLDDSIKSSLAAGALSGHLGVALEQIIRTETAALEIMLARFNAIFQRLVAYAVAMSVVGTLLFCIFYSPGQ